MRRLVGTTRRLPGAFRDRQPARQFEAEAAEQHCLRFVGLDDAADPGFRAVDDRLDFLGDYRGTLQVDAYAGYEAVLSTGRIVEAGCWAHARRRFFDALEVSNELAGQALAAIRRLYEIEREAKELGLDFAARRERRQRDARPLLGT